MQLRNHKGSIWGRCLRTHKPAIKTFRCKRGMMRNDVMTVCGEICNFVDQSIINDSLLIVHGKRPCCPAPHISPSLRCGSYQRNIKRSAKEITEQATIVYSKRVTVSCAKGTCNFLCKHDVFCLQIMLSKICEQKHLIDTVIKNSDPWFWNTHTKCFHDHVNLWEYFALFSHHEKKTRTIVMRTHTETNFWK